MEQYGYDWKKAAAQAVADDAQIERAFMDQAYQFLANKGGALMKDPYRLGFEIVHKNDSNTRMVGIFAFRVGDNLLYVPTFFLNGEIKGTDLLYRHDSKTFVPLEQEWVKYIISKGSREVGRSIPKGDNSRSPKDINFEDIAYPPGGYTAKTASDTSREVRFAQELIKQSKEDGSLLRKFIEEDGGFKAIRKLASYMDSCWEFAEAIANNIPSESYIPDGELGQALISKHKIIKEASTPKPKLQLFVGGLDKIQALPKDDIEKSASHMVKYGYDLWDDRMPDQINPVYQPMVEDMEMIGEPGMYEVLMQDGTTRKAFVGYKSRSQVGEDIGSNWPSDPLCGSDHLQEFAPSKMVIVFDDDNTSICAWDGVYGNQQKTLTEVINDNDLKTTMEAGNAYRIFDPESGSLTEPIYCISKSNKAGIEFYKIHREYGRALTIRRNKDLKENNIPGGLLGADCYFVPVAVNRKTDQRGVREIHHSDDTYYEMCCKEPDQLLGSSATLRDWALETGVKKATLTHNAGDYRLRLSFRDQSRDMNRVSMHCKLACEHRIHSSTADQLLIKAEKDGEVEFLFGEPGATKRASVIRLLGQPHFNMSRDGDFDVDLDYPQHQILETDTDQDEPPEQHIGDAFDPGMGLGPQEEGDGLPHGIIMSSSPEQLAQLAMSSEAPQVFEHGVVGSLVQTFDAVAMIDKYIPDMEQALDRLGRILFLFYWKPRDFEDAYGTDDMANMENQILSNFRSFGDLVLELLKKSERQRRGSVSLAGE